MLRAWSVFFWVLLGLIYPALGCPHLEFNRRYSADELGALAKRCPRYAHFKNDRWQAIQNSVANLEVGVGREDQTPNCGALLISAQYVLTAYHCVAGFYPEPYVFQAIQGKLNFDRVWFLIPEQESRGFRYETFPKERLHFTVEKLDVARDLALLKLKTPIDNFLEPMKVLSFADLNIDPVAQRKHLLAVSSQTFYENGLFQFGVLNFIKLWPDRTLTDNLTHDETYLDEIFQQAIWNRRSFNERDAVLLSFFTAAPRKRVITHGDSGSPVFTFEGNLVGIVATLSGENSKPLTYGGKTPALISKIPKGWLRP